MTDPITLRALAETVDSDNGERLLNAAKLLEQGNVDQAYAVVGDVYNWFGLNQQPAPESIIEAYLDLEAAMRAVHGSVGRPTDETGVHPNW